MPDDKDKDEVEETSTSAEFAPETATTGSEGSNVEITVTPPPDSEEILDEDLIASKEDIDGCIDAIRELTGVIGDVNAKIDEIIVILNAGKF